MERWAFYARRFALTFGQRTANGAEIEHALTKGKKQVRGLVSGTSKLCALPVQLAQCLARRGSEHDHRHAMHYGPLWTP